MIVEEDIALGNALEAAGLIGGDADPEAMVEEEYEMREQLAQVFLDQEPGHRQ
jgi:hypothetical protein